MNFILLLWRWCSAPSHRLLSATLLYYGAAYFVNANIWLLALTLAYVAGLILITKNVVLSLWLALLATLPLAKGKALSLTLIPKTDLVSRNAVFDVNYIFSIYIADAMLGLLGWQLLKQFKLWRSSSLSVPEPKSPPPWHQRAIWWAWAGFLLVVLLPQWHNSLNIVVILSVLQLGKLTLLFLLPSWIGQLKLKGFFDTTVQIAIAGLLFQTGWSLAQYFNGGPLGRYLEAILPIGITNTSAAISTSENGDVLRVTGTFFDPSLLGTYVFTLMAWLWHSLRHTKQPSWLIWGTLILSTLTIILTSNRILIGLLGITIWLVSRKHIQSLAAIRKFWHSKISRVLLVFALVGLLALTPYLWARFQSLNTVFERYGSATYRLQLGWYALRLGSAQPWGVGLNLSPYFLATGFDQEAVSFDPSHPHNLFLQLWAETGWLGVLAVASLLYFIYRPTRTKTGWHWQMSPWGWGGLAFLACALFYPVFINQVEVTSWLAIMLGGHLASRNQVITKATKITIASPT